MNSGRILMTALIVAACGSGNLITSPSDLKVRMEADSAAVIGRTLRLTLLMRNTGSQPASLALRISDGLAFDPIVRDAAGRLVWERLAGQLTAGTAVTIVVAPDSERTYEAFWDLRDQAGNLVPPGTYTIDGRVLLDNGDILTPENSPIVVRIAAK